MDFKRSTLFNSEVSLYIVNETWIVPSLSVVVHLFQTPTQISIIDHSIQCGHKWYAVFQYQKQDKM